MSTTGRCHSDQMTPPTSAAGIRPSGVSAGHSQPRQPISSPRVASIVTARPANTVAAVISTRAIAGISCPVCSANWAMPVSSQVRPVRSTGTPRTAATSSLSSRIATTSTSPSGIQARIRVQRPRNRRPTRVRQETRSTPLAMIREAAAGAHIPTAITGVKAGWPMPSGRNQNGAAASANRP